MCYRANTGYKTQPVCTKADGLVLRAETHGVGTGVGTGVDDSPPLVEVLLSLSATCLS